MRKRVSLARTLIYQPETLLLDEPFGALDAQTRVLMQKQLLDLYREFEADRAAGHPRHRRGDRAVRPDRRCCPRAQDGSPR